MLWDGINRLASSRVHLDLTLALWLQWIAATSKNVKPTQKILAQDEYWVLIQVGALDWRVGSGLCLHV